ncbi:MAG: hypothetical protein ACYC3S_11975 [Chloroflexota bacterium]
MDSLQDRLRIPASALEEINLFLLDPDNPVVKAVLDVVARYGTPEEINARAREARRLPNLFSRLREQGSSYLEDLEWLMGERDRGAFVTKDAFTHRVLGGSTGQAPFDPNVAVTLEISALQYFPFLIAEARQAIERQELMPARYIRVRKMKEQEADGDLLAVAAAMQIVGATYVETLDTKGTDGSNIHLNGPATITGYFGGIGQPNDYPLKWADEFLYYYTNYGIEQVLNTNAGTVLVGYLLYKLGIDCSFKISVFMGNDNPYAIMWTLLGAKLLARPHGTTSLVGFNFSNSVNNETIELSAVVREGLGFVDAVRFEHHITETWKSIVRQPYDRRDELVEIAARVPNISAKHEGGDPAVERTRAHPSDILDYFRDKAEIERSGEMPSLLRNYLDKHEAVNHTAKALLTHGIPVIAAKHLHR